MCRCRRLSEAKAKATDRRAVKTTMVTAGRDYRGLRALSAPTAFDRRVLLKVARITSPCYQFQRWVKVEVKPHLYRHLTTPTIHRVVSITALVIPAPSSNSTRKATTPITTRILASRETSETGWADPFIRKGYYAKETIRCLNSNRDLHHTSIFNNNNNSLAHLLLIIQRRLQFIETRR